MIDWNNISDEEMRAEVLLFIRKKRDEYNYQADLDAEFAANEENAANRRERAASCAGCFRRQAAHYQQAIDLLTAAPMPERSET